MVTKASSPVLTRHFPHVPLLFITERLAQRNGAKIWALLQSILNYAM